jgi:hypothetical protein
MNEKELLIHYFNIDIDTLESYSLYSAEGSPAVGRMVDKYAQLHFVQHLDKTLVLVVDVDQNNKHILTAESTLKTGF